MSTAVEQPAGTREAAAGARSRAAIRPMRVLFALPGLHRVSRGAEVAFESVASHLAGVPGLDITLAGSGPPIAGRPYRFMHVRCRARERWARWPRVPPFRSGIVYEEASFARRLWGMIDPAAYEATVTCAYPFTNWVLRAHTRNRRRPAHIFVTQNGDWAPRARNSEYRYFGCDGLVCTNPEYFERHRGRYRCALIPNGVDTSRFSPGREERETLGIPAGVPVVLIVAALIASKRVAEGIAAAAKIPGAAVVVAGDGPLREQVDRTGRELLGARFRRVSVPHERMPALYRSADVLLHMSTDEPFGNIYLEAMSTGLPVVAHDSLNSRWIIGVHGALADTRDPVAVARALREAITDTDEARRARRAIVADRFAWPVVASQYARFVEEVVTGRAGRA
jgi:glycosyltransferase involved in cell wall biosynthesis